MSKKKEAKKKARVKITDLKLRKEGEGIKGGATTVRSRKSKAISE